MLPLLLLSASYLKKWRNRHIQQRQFYVCDSSNPAGVQDNRVIKRSSFLRDHLSRAALIKDGITITDGGFKSDLANLCNPIITSSLPWDELVQRTGLSIDEIKKLFENYNEIFIRKRNTIER